MVYFARRGTCRSSYTPTCVHLRISHPINAFHHGRSSCYQIYSTFILTRFRWVLTRFILRQNCQKLRQVWCSLGEIARCLHSEKHMNYSEIARVLSLKRFWKWKLSKRMHSNCHDDKLHLTKSCPLLIQSILLPTMKWHLSYTWCLIVVILSRELALESRILVLSFNLRVEITLAICVSMLPRGDLL